MSGLFSKFSLLLKKNPLLRGMVSYSVIWPTSSLIQQTFEGKEKYDWKRCGRYSLYGTFYVAPTLYTWLTVANTVWPGTSFRVGIIKAVVEQLTYTPAAMCSFFFLMSALEGRSLDECIAEVSAKFLPTYKVGVCVWPIAAMVNFCLIPQKNRVAFISCCSLVWTCFLAYMKHLEQEKFNESKVREKIIHIGQITH